MCIRDICNKRNWLKLTSVFSFSNVTFFKLILNYITIYPTRVISNINDWLKSDMQEVLSVKAPPIKTSVTVNNILLQSQYNLICPLSYWVLNFQSTHHFTTIKVKLLGEDVRIVFKDACCCNWHFLTLSPLWLKAFVDRSL